MAFTPKLTYKGKPLVRKDNELYYGNMTDPYVLYLQIMTTKPVGDQQVADKVHFLISSTNLYFQLIIRLHRYRHVNYANRQIRSWFVS